MANIFQNMRPAQIFAIYAFVHCLVWTLVPTLAHPNVPQDVAELVAWGHEWQWGYYKHPPLAPWLAEIVRVIFGSHLWPLYLLSQFCVVACLYCVWLLAKDVLRDQTKALLAALLLVGIYYYNFTSPEFNHNVIMLPFWAAISLFTWRSFKHGKLSNFIILGLLAGLGVLAKYYTALLLVSVALSFILTPGGRAYFKTPAPWLSAVIAIIVVAPHLYWMVSQDFITIDYIFARAGDTTNLLDHVTTPIIFGLTQFGAALGAVILFLLAGGLCLRRDEGKKDDARFLLLLGLGPLALTLAFALITGAGLRSMWGTPLWNMAGIMLLYFFTLNFKRKRFVIALSIFFWVGPLAYYANYAFLKHKRAHFNGQMAADHIQEIWRQNYDRPLPAVFGTTWLAGNISFWATDHPGFMIEGDEARSLWTTRDEFKHTGGVFVWDYEKENGIVPESLRVWFRGRLEVQESLDLPWLRHADQPPFKLGWAMTPPDELLEQKE